MRWRNDPGASQPRNVWRFFPWFIAAGMTAVVAVNFGMVFTALHTFPGNAGGDGFDLSNHYNVVLDRMTQQATLGWTVRAEVDQAAHPIIMLSDRSGIALGGAGIEATLTASIRKPRQTREISSGMGGKSHLTGSAPAAAFMTC